MKIALNARSDFAPPFVARGLLTVTLCIALSACAFAPGMRMSTAPDPTGDTAADDFILFSVEVELRGQRVAPFHGLVELQRDGVSSSAGEASASQIRRRDGSAGLLTIHIALDERLY